MADKKKGRPRKAAGKDDFAAEAKAVIERANKALGQEDYAAFLDDVAGEADARLEALKEDEDNGDEDD